VAKATPAAALASTRTTAAAVSTIRRPPGDGLGGNEAGVVPAAHGSASPSVSRPHRGALMSDSFSAWPQSRSAVLFRAAAPEFRTGRHYQYLR
jgi:hypothetical protein